MRLPESSRGDARCHDGGKGSFLPTLCEFGAQCAACGFRTNTRVIAADDSCATARNGVCEDGGYGSAFITDTYSGGVTSVCGLGTDMTDCASSGVRESQEIGSRLLPGREQPHLASAAAAAAAVAVARAAAPRRLQRLTGTRAPHGSENLGAPGNTHVYELSTARRHSRRSLPRSTRAIVLAPPDNSESWSQLCSDGGYDSTAIFWTNNALSGSPDSADFGCDYGSQSFVLRARARVTRPRTRSAVATATTPSGTCRDSCWVDTEQQRLTTPTSSSIRAP